MLRSLSYSLLSAAELRDEIQKQPLTQHLALIKGTLNADLKISLYDCVRVKTIP